MPSVTVAADADMLSLWAMRSHPGQMFTPLRRAAGIMAAGVALVAAGCSAEDDERLVTIAHELEQADGAEAEELFVSAVKLVAEQDAVHSDEVTEALAAATRDHLALLVQVLSPIPFCDAVAFTEAMMEAGTAGSLYAATLELAQARLAGPPDDPLLGEAISIAQVVGLVTAGDDTADSTEDRGGIRGSFLDGMVLLVHSPSDDIGVLVDGLVAQEVEPRRTSVDDVRLQVQADLRFAAARHEYEVNQAWTSEEIMAIVRNEPGEAPGDLDFFVDGTSDEPRPIKPITEMTEDERTAYEAWVSSDAVGDRVAGDLTTISHELWNIVDLAEGCG